VHTERFGTRHRAALGITEQTDAVVVVVSEENGQISLVQRARIVRNLNEAQLARQIRSLLQPGGEQGPIRRLGGVVPGGRGSRLGSVGRTAGRNGSEPATGDREPIVEERSPAPATPPEPAPVGPPEPVTEPATEPIESDAAAR
jgi:hypothetical protein